MKMSDGEKVRVDLGGLRFEVNAQAREHLPDLIREAGYPKLAESVDAQALRTGWEELRQAVASAPAPTKTITLD